MVNAVGSAGRGLDNHCSAVPSAWVRFQAVLRRLCGSEPYNRPAAGLSALRHWGHGLSRATRCRRSATSSPLRSVVLAALLGPVLAACTVGPDYVRAPAAVPVQYKELKGWKAAAPIDTFDRGPWWSVYKDRRLDELVPQVEISNENVKAAAAAYEQARAIIREAQANLFPTLNGGYGVTRSYTGARVALTTGGQLGASTYTTIYNPQAAGSWAPDVWGKVRRQIESNVAAAQVSAADLANAKLSAQSMLAIAYFNLSATDSLRALLDKTIAKYKRTLEIVRNQVTSGAVTHADEDTVATQLLNTQALATNTALQRAQFEHAIAVLIGRPPADLTIARRSLAENIPKIPVTVPSSLLERRPDVAAAERQMQEQNALIGVAVAGYYPNITLGGTIGLAGGLPLPFNVANAVWSLGATASDTLFDGGLRGAQVDAARAVYWQSVANYRQTVLTAFQQVEDQLAAIRVLSQQLKQANDAVSAAQRMVENYMNQYRTGVVDLTTLIYSQATLLSSAQSALAVRQSLFVASVTLIEALGGGWDASLLPSEGELVKGFSLLPQIY
jgi:NodT family efflux transporter outer membrane factor (OMF) lipoprotein